ncbi:MAG: cell division protein FtsL [Syntrophales bacterium]|nr:cell division protein FtsL [Syntrophales bacterium]MDY0043062.1 cell division protein FtsL [Syntrophales bacterium]
MATKNGKNIQELSLIITGVLVCMIIALVYVWFHVNITKLNYEIAREIDNKNALIEESRRLKVELETLKSPRRIETIANSKLEMIYPEREQVIFLDD